MVVPAYPTDVVGDIDEDAGLLVLGARGSECDEARQLKRVWTPRNRASKRTSPIHGNLRIQGELQFYQAFFWTFFWLWRIVDLPEI